MLRSSVAALVLLAACAPPAEGPWTPLAEAEPAGLLSVTGTAADDVWVVGADKGDGPAVLHWDGAAWERVRTGTTGDLWWAHALPDGPVYLAGAGATVLRHDGEGFERMATPGAGHHTVFGLWAGGEDDVWAVGGYAGRSGFVWHYDGEGWTDLLLPLDIRRRADGELPTLLKVWGDGEGTVWVVGSEGTILRSRGGGALEAVPTPTRAMLFTLHGTDDGVAAVGMDGNRGVVLEWDGSAWVDTTPAGAPPMQGVCLGVEGKGVATGLDGQVLRRTTSGWAVDEDSARLPVESLHAAWVDPDGGQWAVGGDVVSGALDDGVVLYRGPGAPAALEALTLETPSALACPAEAIDPRPDGTIARRWIEQVLGAIRRDTPRPGVHARNLWHTSVAMWDAWAAYDEVADGYVVAEKHAADDVDAARAEAISYAALRVLEHRYGGAVGGEVSTDCFAGFMETLGYDPDDLTTEGDTPRALGNRVGLAVIERFADDGANEAANYADTTGWASVNPPLVVDAPGVEVLDPDLWAPLNLAVAVTQNGLVQESGLQGYIGAHWGDVETFAVTRPAADAPYLLPTPMPRFDDADMDDWVVDVLRKTAWLDTGDTTTMDISPGAIGNNALGSDAGQGFARNPVTGQPYAPNVVPRQDFGRVLAEFWADGPQSETPPGHWYTLANGVADHPEHEPLLFGTDPVDRLEWDVKVYLALGGAVHDAAVVAWELKRQSLSARPIALIRYKGGLGQSTDPSLASYDPDGLPLVDGLIELITAESAAPGERHQHLRHFVGQVAVWTWRGEPGDLDAEVGGHAWVRAVDWIPYQRRTFVTPAFPGFISGHSTFSRSAAEALTQLTGDPFFPGGLGEFVARPGAYLHFEAGPSVEVRLQWATYYDAADQAGQSRLWGGIHIWPDDLGGRLAGATVGELAVERARAFFEGTAR